MQLAPNLPNRGEFYTVSGVVVSPDRAGVGGLRVEIIDRSIPQDTKLAETSTDDKGRYETSIPATAVDALDQASRQLALQLGSCKILRRARPRRQTPRAFAVRMSCLWFDDLGDIS